MSKIRRKLATTAVVCASVMAALLVSGAPAQAAWQAPGTPDSRYPCDDYKKALAPVWFQDCVAVTRTPSGVYVQSVMAVSNLGSTSVGLSGATEIYLDGFGITNTECGDTVIAARARRWCWGETCPGAGQACPSAIRYGQRVAGLGC